MKLNEPYLIIDLNDESLIFFIITCDETNELKIIKKK